MLAGLTYSNFLTGLGDCHRHAVWQAIRHSLLLICCVSVSRTHSQTAGTAFESQAPGQGQQLLNVWQVDRHSLLLICCVPHTSAHSQDRITASELQATGSGQQLLDVWRVDRRSEAAGFAAHSQLDNRRLLWHGTNIAGMHLAQTDTTDIAGHVCIRLNACLAVAAVILNIRWTKDNDAACICWCEW